MVKNSAKFIQLLLVGAFMFSFSSCKQKGCTDINADNFSVDAGKDDGSCSYPTVSFNSTDVGASGDLTGAGGTISKSWTFTTEQDVLDWDMTINATQGSFQLVLKDNDGTVVLDKTLTAGSGPQDAAGVTLAGVPGVWTIEVSLEKFEGTGDYSIL